MGAYRDLEKQKFGKLTVVKDVGKRKHRTCHHWLCKCDCGNSVEVRSDNLTSGKTNSCGCFQKEQVTKHGFWNTEFSKGTMKFYVLWKAIKRRCNNKNDKAYHNYGGRGITYDPKWDDFEAFKKDMYFDYLRAKRIKKIKNPSIERIDVNDDYYKENCCFIEFTDQMKNTRCVWDFVAISPEGVKIHSKNAAEFSRKYGLNSSHVYECLRGDSKTHHGWTFEEVNGDTRLRIEKPKNN